MSDGFREELNQLSQELKHYQIDHKLKEHEHLLKVVVDLNSNYLDLTQRLAAAEVQLAHSVVNNVKLHEDVVAALEVLVKVQPDTAVKFIALLESSILQKLAVQLLKERCKREVDNE